MAESVARLPDVLLAKATRVMAVLVVCASPPVAAIAPPAPATVSVLAFLALVA